MLCAFAAMAAAATTTLRRFPRPWTCSDGVHNGDETAVDCGGACAPCHCFDGLLSGDEEAGHDSAEDFCRLKAPCCTAMDWIFILAYCFAIP